jgi:hypothetical protein
MSMTVSFQGLSSIVTCSIVTGRLMITERTVNPG